MKGPHLFAAIMIMLGISSIGLVAVRLTGTAQVAGPALFQRDHAYVVAWDCLPEWMSQWASANLAGGHPLGTCYSEKLTVTNVRTDGWLDVQDEGGNTWRVNPARMIGAQEAGPPTMRAAK